VDIRDMVTETIQFLEKKMDRPDVAIIIHASIVNLLSCSIDSMSFVSVIQLTTIRLWIGKQRFRNNTAVVKPHQR